MLVTMIERFALLGSKFHRQTILYDTVITTALSVVGKGIGFIVPVFIARWYGATAATDAFFFVYALILFLIGVFSNSVEYVIVPFLAELRTRSDGDQLVGKFVGGLLLASMAIMALLVGLLLLVMPVLLPFVTRLSDAALAYRLLIEISPLVVLVTTSSVLNGTLNAHKIFWVPALSPAVRGIVVLFVAWAFRGGIGIHALSLGYVLAELLRVILAVLALHWQGRIQLAFSLRFTPLLADFIRTTLTFVAGTTVGGLALLIDKAVASFLSVGSVTLLEYARTLFFVPITALSSGFLVVSLAHRSEEFYRMSGNDVRRMLLLSLRPLIAVCVASAIVGASLRYWIVNLVYGKGLLPEQIAVTSDMLLWFMVALLPYTLYIYFTQAFLITRSIIPLVKWAIVNCILVAIFDVMFGRLIGVPGIALATCITYIILAGGLYFEMSAAKPSHDEARVEA